MIAKILIAECPIAKILTAESAIAKILNAKSQTLLLQEIPIGTLCLVQAVRQQYSSIGAACSADMAPHKLRMTISRRVYFL